MPTFKTIHTTLGLAAQAAAAAAGTPINITAMAVGDGNGNPVVPAVGQTGLVREMYRAAPNRIFQSPTDPTRFTAELVIPATTGGFTLREIGLFTASGMLFVVGNLPDTYKPVLADGAYSDTVVRVEFVATNSSVITLQINPAVAVATQQWVTNNVSAAIMIPGGTTGQILRKKTNANGDTEWANPTSVNVTVNAIEETQTLSAGQTVVNWATVNNTGLAVYKNGIRLLSTQFTPHATIPTRITLATGATAGDKLVGVQNDAASGLPVPLEKSQNLADVVDKAVARTNLGVYSKAEVDSQGKQPGDVFYTARTTAPSRSLKANGAAVSRTAYAALFAAIGTTYGAGDGFTTFNLPDMRGEFVRGLDDGRGVDAGRVLGSAQTDAFRSHNHGASSGSAGNHSHTGTTDEQGLHSHGLGGGWSMSRYGYDGGDYGTAAGYSIASTTDQAGQHSHNLNINSAGDHTHSVTVDASGGPETRPRNVALLACIVY